MLARIIKPREKFIKKFGLFNGYIISNKMFPKTKVSNEVKLNVPGYPSSVFIRTNSSDISTFTKVIMDEEYYFETNFNPEFIIDAGANIGLASLYFSKLFKKAQIIAVEPEKKNIQLFNKNNISKNVTCVEGAVWNKNTFLEIKDLNTNTSGFEIIESATETKNTITAHTIGDIFNKSTFKTIDVLKIDIEGAEYEVFSNNYESWLPKTKILIIELHDRFREGCTDVLTKALSNYQFEKFEKGENVFYVNKAFQTTIKL